MSKFTDILKSPIQRLLGARLNSKGSKIPSPPEPGSKSRASYAIKKQPKRTVSYEINDIKSALTLAGHPEQPNRAKLTEIYYYILQDSHLSSQIQAAVQKVLAEPYALYNDSKADQEASKVIQSPWFENLLVSILDAEWFGFRLVELIKTDEGGVEFEVIPNENVCPEFDTIWLLTPWQKPFIEYKDMADDLNLIFLGSKKDLGVLHKAAYNILWKFYARSDWSRASEKFGMPILSIEANTNNDAELDRLEQRASTFGSDGYIVTQDGDKVNIIERKGEKSHEIYLQNIRYCDEQISKLINGQTGSSDEKSFTGAAQVHERLMEDITYARMRRVMYTINNQVLPYLKTRQLVPEGITEFSFTRFKSEMKPKSEIQPDPETNK